MITEYFLIVALKHAFCAALKRYALEFVCPYNLGKQFWLAVRYGGTREDSLPELGFALMITYVKYIKQEKGKRRDAERTEAGKK